MNTVPINWIILAAILVIAMVVTGALVAARRRKESQRLRERFGPEYDRTVEHFHSRAKAEAELKSRERRVERLNITALEPAEATRFSQAWNALQVRFVDNPKGVVVQADQLVRELMDKRGYPVGDFERRATDISVDHPAVVENYRAAQAIAARDLRGEASTEELRKAVVHYRTLFDELLEVRAQDSERLEARQIPVHS